MSVSYAFTTDLKYYRELIERYYQQRSQVLKPRMQFGAIFLCWLVFSAYEWLNGLDSHASILLFALGFGLFCAGAVYLTNALILRKLTSKGQFNKELTVRLSTQGLVFSGVLGSKEYPWSYYPRSVRYCDGILLLRSGKISWLPDHGITSGSPSEAEATVRAATQFRLSSNNSFKPNPLRSSKTPSGSSGGSA
jgi:hypothetical protein